MRSVYLTGLWRSGTSMMLRLFDGHPDVCAMPAETGIISIIVKNPEVITTLKKTKTPIQLLCYLSHLPVTRFQDIIDATFNGMSFSRNQIFYSFSFDLEEFGKLFFDCIQTEDELEKIIFGYYEAIKSAWKDCSTQKEKPFYAIQRAHRRNLYPGEDPVRFVMETLPDMGVVEIVRHPVWQINSVMKSGAETIEQAVVAWAFAAAEVSQRQSMYPDGYKMIRYEDVIEKTDVVMTDLADFLGLEMNQTLTMPSFNGDQWHGNSFFGKKGGLEQTSVMTLSQDQIDYIQRTLDHYMSKLGYDNI